MSRAVTEQIELSIEGMHCAHCVESVRKALEHVDGVRGAAVDLEAARAVVEMDPQTGSHTALVAAVEGAGYQVVAKSRLEQPSIPLAAAATSERDDAGGDGDSNRPSDVATRSRLTLDIGGMHCASCVQRVSAALADVPGVVAARANLATEQASVDYSDDQVDTQQLLNAVHNAGYSAQLASPSQGGDLESRLDRQLQGWARRLAVGAALLSLIIVLHFAPTPVWAAWVSAIAAVAMLVYVGQPYLGGAWRRLRHGSTNMDTLVALGTSVAVAAGLVAMLRGTPGMYFMDAGMILVFITLGRLLETRAKGRASSAIRKLLDLAPAEATVVTDGQTHRIPAEAVEVGELVLVRPGERVSLDAEIVEGHSQLDESWLTGESLPVEKKPGDEILTGSINGSASLKARVLRPVGDSALARVIELVRRAQESKADVERLADRVIAYFVPTILAIAATTLLAWGLFGPNWSTGLSAGVAVLIVACPCALGLATPTAVLVASGRGAELGILVKDARALEQAGRLTTIVLDKTGTVTLGKPQVVQVHPVGDSSDAELLATAAAAEQMSEHPLAACVVQEAKSRCLELPPAEQLQVEPGQGVRAVVDGKRALVGTEVLLAKAGMATDQLPVDLSAIRADGANPLCVAWNGRVLGVIAIADGVARHSGAAIADLKQLGLEVALLSGDHRVIAESVARQVGIEEVTAEVRPEEKSRYIDRLRARGKRVAMVGDGINDAPALAAADVGIAIGAGSDVAIETADLVLVGEDLRSLVRAVRLSRATLRTIWQNLGWAFVYNLALVPVAAGALALIPGVSFRLPPAAAAAAMAASSVSVVLNSLRLRRRALD